MSSDFILSRPPTRETFTKPSYPLPATLAGSPLIRCWVLNVRCSLFFQIPSLVTCHPSPAQPRGIFPAVNRQSINGTIQLNHGWTRINTDLNRKICEPHGR